MIWQEVLQPQLIMLLRYTDCNLASQGHCHSSTSLDTDDRVTFYEWMQATCRSIETEVDTPSQVRTVANLFCLKAIIDQSESFLSPCGFSAAAVAPLVEL